MSSPGDYANKFLFTPDVIYIHLLNMKTSRSTNNKHLDCIDEWKHMWKFFNNFVQPTDKVRTKYKCEGE